MTFNVTTTAPHQVARQDLPHHGVPSEIALAGLFALFLPAVRRRRPATLCLLGLGLVLTLGLVACGGSSGGGGGGNLDSATAPCQYYFTVTATTGSGASQVTTTAQVPVLVN